MSKVKTKKKLTEAQKEKIKIQRLLKVYDVKSFEYSELERVREAWENYILYSEGLQYINGAYSEVKIDDCDEDYVYFKATTGEQDMGSGHSSKHTSLYKIRRKYLLSKMSLKEKINKIVDWDYEDGEDE